MNEALGGQIQQDRNGWSKAVTQGVGLGRASEPKAGSRNPLDMCGWPPSSDAVSLPYRITMNRYPAAIPLSNQIKVNSLVKFRVWVAFICYLIRVSGSGLPRAYPWPASMPRRRTKSSNSIVSMPSAMKRTSNGSRNVMSAVRIARSRLLL